MPYFANGSRTQRTGNILILMFFLLISPAQTSVDGNLTRSTLTYTPMLEDQGKYVSCRAEQTLIPESGIEQGFKLDIHRE